MHHKEESKSRYHVGWTKVLFSLLWCQRRQQWTSRLKQIVVSAKPNLVYIVAASGNLGAQFLIIMWKSFQLKFGHHCMFDCYVIADVSRLNTYIMFMHLKADPASYEGLFEKVNSSVWLPLNLLCPNRWNIMSLGHWTSLYRQFWRGVEPRRLPTCQELTPTALSDQTPITMR